MSNQDDEVRLLFRAKWGGSNENFYLTLTPINKLKCQITFMNIERNQILFDVKQRISKKMEQNVSLIQFYEQKGSRFEEIPDVTRIFKLKECESNMYCRIQP